MIDGDNYLLEVGIDVGVLEISGTVGTILKVVSEIVDRNSVVAVVTFSRLQFTSMLSMHAVVRESKSKPFEQAGIKCFRPN